MTEPSNADSSSAATVKRRQYLLLAGLVAIIIGAAMLSTTLTGTKDAGERARKPAASHILAPGAQVDPRDAWRGQADAQLKTIEQKSRDLSQRNSELEGQSKEMMERLKKLEQTSLPPGLTPGLTPLPPPPRTAPAVRPDFGPDRPMAKLSDTGPQRLPLAPPLSPQVPQVRSASSSQAGLSLPPPINSPTPALAGIVRVTLGDGSVTQAVKAGTLPGKGANSAPVPHDTRSYISSGAFARAILLGGLDAPTGGQAQHNPQPVLLRLVDNAVLPNLFRASIKECFVVGAGYGDISSERAYIRTESLSCVTRAGKAMDIPVKGYVAGEDGKAGMRGRLVSKQGQILANALVAGVASGIGHAFQQSSTTTSISPLGATSTVDPGKQLGAGLGTGVGQALDRLAQYYISLAEKVFPVIEVDAGRSVDIVITQGVALPGPLDATDDELDPFPQLVDRTRPLRSNDDDPQ